MFRAYYKDIKGERHGPVLVFQILANSIFPSGYEVILYNSAEDKWMAMDLDNIVPVLD